MKKSVRWVDWAQKFTRKLTMRQDAPKEFLLICTGGADHLVFLAAQLDRFRLALGGARVPLVVLARHDAGAAEFLFDGRAEVIYVNLDRFGDESGYRANKMSEIHQSNFIGVVSLDYHRHPDLHDALVMAAQRPARAMKPAPMPGLDDALAERGALYQAQFDSGSAGIPLPLRWEGFGFDLAAEDPDLPEASPYRLSDDLMPEPAVLEKPTVLLQPFCPDPARQPAAGLYGPVLDAVVDGHQVLLLGNESLLDRTPELRRLLERPGVALLETDLAGALPIIRGARLVISAESAPMHLAALAGVPTLGLVSDFGNGDTLPYPETNGPANARVLVVNETDDTRVADAVRELLAG